jgi:hypothetical protein
MERIVKGLGDLGYPQLNQISNPQVLIESSDIRLTILEWLFRKYDPNIEKDLSYEEKESVPKSKRIL